MLGALPCAVLVTRGGWLGHFGYRPGLAHTGWGIIEERRGEVRCRAYGCIETSAGSPLAVRLSHIARDLKGVVERYRPILLLSRASTLALMSARQSPRHMPAVPRSWRFRSARSRSATYTLMQIKQAVVVPAPRTSGRSLHGAHAHAARPRPHPDHAADALACAICHVNLSRTRALTGGEFYQQRGTGY